jgi:hypothetical protein
VACDPTTSRWKTLAAGGEYVIDCVELAAGERPDTVCACHHLLNPACCERPDCILPSSAGGQHCPPTKGALCSPCSPAKPECQEQGAKCVTTNSKETYCGRLCSPTSPCPSGYQCMVVKLPSGAATNQCIPQDFSCYY